MNEFRLRTELQLLQSSARLSGVSCVFSHEARAGGEWGEARIALVLLVFTDVFLERSSRASYGDDAISYVQLKRDAHLCTVKCKMCPEHKVHAKLYGCTLIIDEEDDVIVSVVCEDCVASRALIEKVKEETIEQSKSNLWFELRYGRITASKAYEVSRCKTADGTLVSLILGGKIPETKHMKRGRVLEDQVRRTVEDMLKKLPSAVLY
ncbi:hypothetical protein EVAR_11324_1 [Eumeta japonica]|uniref:Uncharacterized protein n=1 Tax=Eumeta variegata TaxID=151549 RepID=A0A4C1U1J9_EUMVA|nr:hypothetical protein EVAR_11324_1 [Eumeta japonica]